VTSLTLPDGAVEQWSYLGTGQTSGYTSPLGYTNAYVFDDAGQMTMVNYPTGTDTTFAYDASGRHTQMVDSTGTTTYTYNAAGEITSLAQPQGTTTYTYNAAGQRLTMNEAGSGTTTYSYDTAGRLASLVNPFSETTSFVYDTLGRVGQKTLANGTSEHYAYDTRSRLTQVQLKQGATVLRTTGYAWDNADQITSQTVNGLTTNYGYDLAGQLTSEIRTGYNVAYTYDANGNRTSKTVNGAVESYTYDLGDKMLTAGAKSYTYDAAGRTIGINAPGGTTTLTYDYESRVTAITGPGINETHTYNGLDTRVGTVQGGVSRTFVRDGSYVTDPVLRDGQATYTPGVSERRGGVSTWSHSGLKNADAQTSSVGVIAATRVYDAFGAELSATGTWKGPFGYAGGFGYQEDSSGLKLLGHRYYDSTTGRFLSRDPIKDGRNWYAYCENTPISRVDPRGTTSTVAMAILAVDAIETPPGKNVGDYALIFPPGVSLEANARRVRPDTMPRPAPVGATYLPESSAVPGQSGDTYDNVTAEYGRAWTLWLLLVWPKCEWDYKKDNPLYENFGNLNYGYTAAAIDMPLELALRGAGGAQVLVGTNDPKDGGPFGGPPYGDDPRDQHFIRRGYMMYQSAQE
jgi:RHS repeat-associated protein